MTTSLEEKVFYNVMLGGSSATSYVPSALDNYESTTFTLTPSGAVATGSLVVNARRIGNIVTLTWPQFAFNATAGAALGLSTIPARFRPINQLDDLRIISNNSVVATGYMQITTGGAITIFSTVGGGAFTNAAPCVFYEGAYSYAV